MAKGWDGCSGAFLLGFPLPGEHSSWCAGCVGALGLPDCRNTTWPLSVKLLKKGFKLWGGAGVAMLCPWDLLTVVSFFAEIDKYHSKQQSESFQTTLETSVSTNLEVKI